MGNPSLKDIAERAGLSKNAVSLALRHDPRVSAKTRARVEALAAEMGYQRNPALGALMSQIRKRAHTGSMGTLALFNAHPDPDAFRNHATIPPYVAGCTRRASALGYAINTFWMHDPEVTAQRWVQILRHRGILGVVIVGLMKQNRLPPHILPLIDAFPCVVTGVRTRDPALSFACVDHHIVALRAFERSLERGYERPGIVLDGEIDRLVDHRFSAGYATGQLHLRPAARLRPFTRVSEAHQDPTLFREWLESERPDVIFTLYNVVRDWLRAFEVRVPEDMGLIQLEWRANRPRWAGMNQRNDMVGEAAIDLLISMTHHGERGAPPYPRGTLIGPTWVDGETVRSLPKPLPDVGASRPQRGGRAEKAG